MDIKLLVDECNKFLSSHRNVNDRSTVVLSLYGFIRRLLSSKKCLPIFGGSGYSETNTFAFTNRIHPCATVKRHNKRWMVDSLQFTSDYYDYSPYLSLINNTLSTYVYDSHFPTEIDDLISFKNLEAFKF